MLPDLLPLLRRAVGPLVLACVVLWSPSRASAGEPTPRIAVKIGGPIAAKVRDNILAVVPEGIEVVDDGEFTVALAQSGLPGGNLGFSLTSPQMRPAVLKIVRRAVGKRELAGAVLGRIKRGRKGPELVLVYVEAEGEPPIDTTVPMSGGDDAQQSALREALAPVFDELAPTPEPEEPEEPEEPLEAEEDEEDEEDDEPSDFVEHQAGSELLSLAVGMEFGGRFFSYGERDDSTANLRPYDYFGAPGILVGGTIYPAATTGVPFLQDLGATISFMHAFGIGSRTDDGSAEFSTTYYRLWAGLNYRFRIGERDDHPVVLNLNGRFGLLNFQLEASDALAEQIQDEAPSVEYMLMRAGLDARIPIGAHFALIPAIAYVGPLSGGPIYDQFTEPSQAAIDAGLAFAIPIDMGFEITAGFNYTGVFTSFDSLSTDRFIADSATDHLVALHLGAAFLY